MSSEPDLPKDPTGASEFLAALTLKDQNESLCRYPTCHELRLVTGTGAGRPSAYCTNPDHTPVTNHRLRQQVKALAAGTPLSATTGKRDGTAPVGIAVAESLRTSVVKEMAQLRDDLARYLTLITEIADPDIASAQMQVIVDRADAQVAQAQQTVSTERSLRLVADAARDAALQEARAEREAAEEAIRRMEETERRMRDLEDVTTQHVREIQAERDATVTHVREQARGQIEAMSQEARAAIDDAEARAAQAITEAREAQVHAHAVQVEANAHIASAERLVRETQTTLERERTESDRLRSDLASVRTQADADRQAFRTLLEREHVESDRLRAELATLRTQAEVDRQEYRATLERERAESDRLRSERAAHRQHIEQFAQQHISQQSEQQ